MRRELDRAASKWATESGGLTGLMMTGDLIATEVVSVGFEYFDGTIWQLTWNSDTNQAMPKAIRITLTVTDETATSNVDTLTTGIAAGTRTFTHIVQLPVGMLVQPATDPATAETTGTTGTTETDASLPPTGGT